MNGIQVYITRPNNLEFTLLEGVSRPVSKADLILSANHCIGSKPQGIIATEGELYSATPEGLPALVVNGDNAEIKEQYGIPELSNAHYVVSGTAMLIKDSEKTSLSSPVVIKQHERVHRVGVGVKKSGEVVFVIDKCTVKELQSSLHLLGCTSAMMGAYGDVYVNYKKGEVYMSRAKPVTVFEALDVKELPRPIVVLDPGHGGTDPGARGFGFLEKDLNLRGAKIARKYLEDNYEGTFLLTRDDDRTVLLDERTEMANAINADLFMSFHHNAFNGAARGFETFRHRDSKTAFDYHTNVHNATMDFLGRYNVPDRGAKTAGFYVTNPKHIKCPSVLVENLFMDNVNDVALLNIPQVFQTIYEANAEGIVRTLKLQRKATVTEPEQPPMLYRVQIGAFRHKKNAEDLLEQLRKAGFDGFIREVEG